MEINKQLFEDVLSGKLKGTFVLRNKQIIKSTTLKRSPYVNFPYAILIKYDNGVTDYGTFKSNGDFESLSLSYFDIIDFIPDTNMKENELTIEIPEGKEIDWDESKKQNKIVLKDKQLTYRNICDVLFEGGHYYINGISDIEHSYTNPYFANTALTEHQLECILAKNKLANVAVYLNGGWKPAIEETAWYIISYGHNKIDIVCDYIGNSHCSSRIIFKSEELAQQAIEILGEETVKLALEPLGI